MTLSFNGRAQVLAARVRIRLVLLQKNSSSPVGITEDFKIKVFYGSLAPWEVLFPDRGKTSHGANRP